MPASPPLPPADIHRLQDANGGHWYLYMPFPLPTYHFPAVPGSCVPPQALQSFPLPLAAASDLSRWRAGKEPVNVSLTGPFLVLMNRVSDRYLCHSAHRWVFYLFTLYQFKTYLRTSRGGVSNSILSWATAALWLPSNGQFYL